jgi:hypothetical protein
LSSHEIGIVVVVIIAAYGTLFIAMPRWLSIIISVLFFCLGSAIVYTAVMGIFFTNMFPHSGATFQPMFITGVLVLLSRLVVYPVLLALRYSPHPQKNKGWEA